MDMLKKFFPYSFKEKDVKGLVITLVIYVLADIICGAVIGLLGAIPLVGWIFSIIGSIIGLYFLVAIVLAILDFVGVFKK